MTFNLLLSVPVAIAMLAQAEHRTMNQHAAPSEQAQHAEHHADAADASERHGDPYPLAVCPISGQALGSMGDPVVKLYERREIRFCCGACPEKFEADISASMSKVDAMIVESQRAFYPLATCLVSGEPLTVEGEDIAIEYVHQNRFVRLCCKGCVADLKAEPAKFMHKLDAAVAAAQRDQYPITTCVVSGEDMTDLAEDDVIEVVVANRLFRLCCPPCKPDVLADPAPYIERLDAAWAKEHGGPPSMPGAHGEHDTDADHHGAHGAHGGS